MAKTTPYTAKLKRGILRGVLRLVAKQDVRYYLNGAAIDFDRQLIMGTDGHRIIVVKVEANGKGVHIMPRRLLEQVKGAGMKARDDVLEIEVTPPQKKARGSVTIRDLAADYGFALSADLIDGRYPDVASVIPVEISGELCQANPQYLADAERALSDVGCVPNTRGSSLVCAYNGDKHNILCYLESVPDAFVLVMSNHVAKFDVAKQRAEELAYKLFGKDLEKRKKEAAKAA